MSSFYSFLLYPPTPAKQGLAPEEDVPLRSMCHTVPSICQRAGQASQSVFVPGLPFAFWLWAVAPLGLHPLSVAVPKLCHRLFLTRFRRTVFGPQTASFLVRFWAFCARRAAAFPCFERARSGNRNRFPGHWLAFWPCTLCPWLCQSSAKSFFLQDADAPFSVRRRPRFRSVFGAFCARRAAF